MSLSTTTRRAVLGSFSAAALMLSATLPAYATDGANAAEPAHNATYVNGGIGASDEQHMRQIARNWPLRMIFSANKSNEFVADAKLRVTDTHGTPRLQLDDAGPMTYARLPAGTYRVTATLDGRSETREITLDGKGGRDVYFHWKGAA